MNGDSDSRAGAVLEIDLGAIVENWRTLARLAAPAQCAAVVKANGYGLGVAQVGRALLGSGCRLFFVATLDEGVVLRQVLGPVPEVAVFNGPMRGTAIEFAAHDLIPVLNEPGQIAEWEALTKAAAPGTSSSRAMKEGGKRRTPPNAILHIDTGMSRLGVTANEFEALLADAPRSRWRAVMSHLACADVADHPQNERQRARFADAAARIPPGTPASLAASSGIFLSPAYRFDLVRPGAALYGINPQPGRPNPMRRVVRLGAKILQIRQIDRGESVGYGAAHLMQAAGRVATVAIGYADGWLRSIGGRGCGFIADRRVPLIGRVSMDLATFDVSAVPEELAHPGMTIELLGRHYGIDDAAADAGTIGYEILTALGGGGGGGGNSRCQRTYREPVATKPLE
jgi:alanine racemase